MHNATRFAVVVTLVALSGVATAEVYRWVDEQGNVQFGDQPTQQSDAETVKLPASRPPDPQTMERMENQKRYLDARQTDREKDVEQKKKDEARAQEYATACEQSKQRLATLDGGTRVYVEKDGERRYLSDEERAQEIESTKKKIDEYCSGPPKK